MSWVIACQKYRHLVNRYRAAPPGGVSTTSSDVMRKSGRNKRDARAPGGHPLDPPVGYPAKRLDHTSRLSFYLHILKVPDIVELRTAVIMYRALPMNIQKLFTLCDQTMFH